MSYRNFLLIIALTVTIVGTSCSSTEDSRWKEHSENTIKKLIGKPIDVNDTLQFFPNLITVENLLDSKCKIVFCVNIDCSVCVLKFEYWQNFIDSFMAKNNIQPRVLAIVSGHTSSGTIQEYITNKWKHEWVYDPEEDFIFEYEIEDDRFQTMVLDESNKIILIGNPVHNKAMEPLYEKTLLKAYQ